jgi:hypothetical protein
MFGGERIAVVQKRIDQRAGVIAVCRMDNHPRRLVHDQNISIFVHHGQGDVLRRQIGRRGPAKFNMDSFSGTHLMAGPHAFPVDENPPATDRLLYLGPRGILNMTGQKEIKALFLLPGRDNNVEDRIQE